MKHVQNNLLYSYAIVLSRKVCHTKYTRLQPALKGSQIYMLKLMVRWRNNFVIVFEEYSKN